MADIQERSFFITFVLATFGVQYQWSFLLNIAFVNELSMIFHKMGIDTVEVLEAAGTKWNFLPFRPGLVGGHCIGVDPYYLTHKAQELNFHPEIILSGRRVNDNMGTYVANRIIKLMIKKGHNILNNDILVLGITFKENCPDIRNSKVIDLINELKNFGANVDVFDNWAKKEEVYKEYSLELIEKLDKKYKAIVLAVAHNEFKNLNLKELKFDKNSVVFDLKAMFDKQIIDERL